jgi:dTMP kinase
VLVTIEGIDGSGKSTLHESLGLILEDLHPVMTREPGSTWIGDAVRQAIREKIDPVAEALLFVADHAAHLSTIVRPALIEGRIVISDRFIDSRFAYQQVTLEGILPDPASWLKAVHNGWTVIPDLTILITVPVEVALNRTGIRKEKEHFEEHNTLESVQKNYLSRVELEPWRYVILDGTMPKEQILTVTEEAIRYRKEIIEKKQKKKNYLEKE